MRFYSNISHGQLDMTGRLPA